MLASAPEASAAEAAADAAGADGAAEPLVPDDVDDGSEAAAALVVAVEPALGPDDVDEGDPEFVAGVVPEPAAIRNGAENTFATVKSFWFCPTKSTQ